MNQTGGTLSISQFIRVKILLLKRVASWNVFLFKITGFTSSTFPIQPDFVQNQLAAITLNTSAPGHCLEVLEHLASQPSMTKTGVQNERDEVLHEALLPWVLWQLHTCFWLLDRIRNFSRPVSNCESHTLSFQVLTSELRCRSWKKLKPLYLSSYLSTIEPRIPTYVLST